MENKEQVLRSIYYDPGHPAGLTTAMRLFKASKELLPNLSLNEVQEWLNGEITYTLHKPLRRHFKRNPIIVEHIDQQWEADLVEMREFSKKNKGFNYILTVIDVMSKYAWAESIKDKSQNSIIRAFQSIFDKGRHPKFIRTDRGKEFLNKKFKSFLEGYSIYHFTSKNQTIKCSIVERFNRTLKGRMYKYFTSKGTRVWCYILPDLVSAYNNTLHRTIKMTPVEASESNNKILFKNIYGVTTVNDLYDKTSKTRLVKGDLIRKAENPDVFSKSFYPNWTDRTYNVSTIAKEPVKPMINIEDEKNLRYNQRFYPEEIQKINENLYRVEKVLKTRKLNGKKQHFVKWLNYPTEYNSWIEDTNIVHLNK